MERQFYLKVFLNIFNRYCIFYEYWFSYNTHKQYPINQIPNSNQTQNFFVKWQNFFTVDHFLNLLYKKLKRYFKLLFSDLKKHFTLYSNIF
jgi:hypothetical protein